MKKVLIVFSLLLLASFACAIDVSGPVSGTWAIGDSPVNVTGEISVDPGNQLIKEISERTNVAGDGITF